MNTQSDALRRVYQPVCANLPSFDVLGLRVATHLVSQCIHLRALVGTRNLARLDLLDLARQSRLLLRQLLPAENLRRLPAGDGDLILLLPHEGLGGL